MNIENTKLDLYYQALDALIAIEEYEGGHIRGTINHLRSKITVLWDNEDSEDEVNPPQNELYN